MEVVAIKYIATKEAKQYMLRLPPGLKDCLARRAAENGRSMNSEIIQAIEKHLEGGSLVNRIIVLEAKVAELMRSRDASFVVR